VAAHLQHVHTRLLGEALADAAGVPVPPPLPPAKGATPVSWVYDVALRDLRDVIVPAIGGDAFAATRTKGVARLLKYLQTVDSEGGALDAAERDELAGLLGHPVEDECRPASITVDAVDELGRTLHAVGRPVSRCVFNAYPHMFCWTSLTEWEFDGMRAWGEDQDVRHPGKWRRFVLDARGRP
jgi:hypothetical protein